MLVNVTVALGMLAPDASVTVPCSDPVAAVCAIRDGRQTASRHTNSVMVTALIFMTPLSVFTAPIAEKRAGT